VPHLVGDVADVGLAAQAYAFAEAAIDLAPGRHAINIVKVIDFEAWTMSGDALPVAIGGIGGSGTRIVAALLAASGYYLGDDLNDAFDNLWFTLLFKRRSILLESDCEFRALVGLLFSRMSGRSIISNEERTLLFQLANEMRPEAEPKEWLLERVSSFSDGRTSRSPNQPWGWKEPNTHIIIERIFRFQPHLKYIHVVRHPLDMATSQNQNQLRLWGSEFLNRRIEITPQLSLSFWCVMHRRVTDFLGRWPARTMMVDFDALCEAPDRHCAQITEFLAARSLENDSVRKLIRRPETIGRFKNTDLRQFDPSDLAYVAKIGYLF
jgi:hypothetical protein